MVNKVPGKHFRKGISIPELFKMFPSNEVAERWLIERRWPTGICCHYCGSLDVNTAAKHKTMPFRCREKVCGKRFSTKTGTFMESSNLGFQTWLFAIYLIATSHKSVSSMKLHRDVSVTQKTAWHLVHRIRRSMATGSASRFVGPVEVDETYIGGKRRNMPKSKREALTGRGSVGKTAVVGVKDRETNEVRAAVVEHTDAETLQGFVHSNAGPEATVYTDDASAYAGVATSHESVSHSVGEYVRGQVHTNGIESFWSMLKRAHKGTFHKMSANHLGRYVDEFSGRHNMRDKDTLQQMVHIAGRMENAQLRYKDLVG